MSCSLFRLATSALVVAGLAATAVPSHAFRMIQNTSVGRFSAVAGAAVACNAAGGFTHWNNKNIPWYLNTAGQGSGKSGAVSGAVASWTVAGNPYHLSYAGTTTAGFSTDGRNTVLWTSGAGCSGSCLAITALVLQAGQVIVESDIAFNPSHSWQTSGGDVDTQAVMTHEMGHALGIHHTNLASTPQPTMSVFYLGSSGRTLESDDVQALQCAGSRY